MVIIKLLTLNTHSLIEENYHQKLIYFVDGISRQLPDIIALQEVNQSIDADILNDMERYFPCQDKVPIKEDNHAYNICRMLAQKNIFYHWTWLPVKNGYKAFDEGLALLSRTPITKTDSFLVSRISDYNNWRTRKVLGIYTENSWFYSVHLSWWNDADEPFQNQWKKLSEHLKNNKNVWLMGDFNNPAEIRHEGYDLITSSGWHDVCTEKEEYTVDKVIDGWKDKIKNTDGMRIDFIFTNKNINPKQTEVIFNGINEAVVSDHFGVSAII